MVNYELVHSSGKVFGPYKSIKSARADALRIIKRNYPKHGKHFADLGLFIGKKYIGHITLGDKYRGRKHDHLSTIDQLGMRAYLNDYYVAYDEKMDETFYWLEEDGSLGKKFVYVKGVLGYLPVGFAKTKEEAIRKLNKIKQAGRTARNTPRKDFMSEHIGVYSVGKNGTLKRVK